MPSPFDDLLKEFDDPLGGPEDKPPEDPLRGENLEPLMKLSKKIEGIAATLDPSEPKHPLYNQRLPEEARLRLKEVINALMDVQGELHELEKALLDEAEKQTPPSEPSSEASFSRLSEELSSRTQPAEPDLDSFPEHPHKIDEPRPVTHIAEQSEPRPEPSKTSAPAPQPLTLVASPDLALLEQEKRDFDIYKTKWERVFAEDPSQRLAHPEVAAYYTQMETYFQEKEAYLKQTSST